MKQSKHAFYAAVAVGLLMASGAAIAEPSEACSFPGQQGYSYEQIGLRNGWHLWQCEAGSWQYVHFCGRAPC